MSSREQDRTRVIHSESDHYNSGYRLTLQELEIAYLFFSGGSYIEIADTLGVSVKTIRNRASELLNKVGDNYEGSAPNRIANWFHYEGRTIWNEYSGRIEQKSVRNKKHISYRQIDTGKDKLSPDRE